MEYAKEVNNRLKTSERKKPTLATLRNLLKQLGTILRTAVTLSEEEDQMLRKTGSARCPQKESIGGRIGIKAIRAVSLRKWRDFHNRSRQSKQGIAQRQRDVDNARKQMWLCADQNEAESKRLVQERRALQDGYTALGTGQSISGYN